MGGAEFLAGVVIIGVLLYFTLLEMEERRSRRISDELKADLEARGR